MADAAYSVGQALDGGYFVAGATGILGKNRQEALILKLDVYGNISPCQEGMVKATEAEARPAEADGKPIKDSGREDPIRLENTQALGKDTIGRVKDICLGRGE